MAERTVSFPELLLRLPLTLAVVIPVSMAYFAVCLVLVPWRTARIYAGNLYGKVIGPSVFAIAGIRPVFDHPERLGAAPALYVCNHASTADMWIGMWACPYGGCGVAKKEIVRIPFFGWCYWLSGHLLLDRGDRSRAIEAMERATAIVRRRGLSVWMWPEGTRSRDGRLQPLKKGFAHLAIAAKLPVVPVVFHGAHRRWPGGTFTIRPGELPIQVLEPIDTSSWREETLEAHVHEVWQAFYDALPPDQRPPE